MNFTFNLATIESFIRNLGKYAVIVNDFTHTANFGGGNLGTTVKGILTGVAGLMFFVDHKAAAALKVSVTSNTTPSN